MAIHIGQAGIQIGNSCWELFCLEHGVDAEGRRTGSESGTVVSLDGALAPLDGLPPRSASISASSRTYDASESFFLETAAGRMVPRALMVDLEPTVVGTTTTLNSQPEYACTCSTF